MALPHLRPAGVRPGAAKCLPEAGFRSGVIDAADMGNACSAIGARGGYGMYCSG